MVKWRLVLIAAAVGACSTLHASDKSQESFFSRHKGPIAATAISTTIALAFFVANRIAIMREQAAREKAFAALRAQYAETISITLSLQGRFDALPLNDFMRQADLKIAQMRQLLADDVVSYKETIAQMTKELKSQADRLNKDLAERQAYLENVRVLLEGIRDNNNLNFLSTLIDLKMEVEAALAQLSHDKMTLSGNLMELTARTHDLQSHMTRNHSAIHQIDEEVGGLRKEIATHREEAESAKRYMRRLGEEIADAKRTIQGSQKEFDVLNADLKEKLRSMQVLAREGREQKEVAAAEVDQARAVLAQVRHRVMQLEAIAGQEERRVQELAYRIDQANALADAPREKPSPRLIKDKKAESEAYSKKEEISPVSAAVSTLKEMLAPFTSEALSSPAVYRKAYMRFSMKNHPDKGGSSAVFQAVDGLYKIILDHDLFDVPSRYLSGHVEALLTQYSKQCRMHKGLLRI